MEGISISMPEVSATASSLRSTNRSLDETLKRIQRIMNDTAQTYQSESGERIRAKFNSLTNTMNDYRMKVDDYAKFLDQTVANYAEGDAGLKNTLK